MMFQEQLKLYDVTTDYMTEKDYTRQWAPVDQCSYYNSPAILP